MAYRSAWSLRSPCQFILLLHSCFHLDCLSCLNSVSRQSFFACRTLEVLCHTCLGTGEGKILDSLSALKKYISPLALWESGDPNIVYNPEYTMLAFQGWNISISQVQSGLNQLIEDTWAQLLTLTNNIKTKLELPPSMSEDIYSTQIGDALILLRPRDQISNGVMFKVDPSSSQEFFHSIKPVLEAIAFFVHTTGSGPLHLSEVVDDWYCNGSGPRNLLISHGAIFHLRRNLKTSAIQGCKSSVVHYSSTEGCRTTHLLPSCGLTDL